MNILKRVEIWVLLLLVGGVIAFVVATGGDGEDRAALDGPAGNRKPGAAPAAGKSAAFAVDAAHLKRDVGNGILEIHITYDNQTGADIKLLPPAARLLSGPDPGDGDAVEEVSPFFLAFSPPPVAPAGRASPAVLKFWLEKRHLEGALWLRILDDTLAVKSSAPLDLGSLPDQETAVFKGADWAASPSP